MKLFSPGLRIKSVMIQQNFMSSISPGGFKIIVRTCQKLFVQHFLRSTTFEIAVIEKSWCQRTVLNFCLKEIIF